MSYSFTLCDDCRTSYASLQFDPTASYGFNIVPFAAIMWPDEHPANKLKIAQHRECWRSIMRMVSARTSLWHTGTIPEQSQALWDEARRVLPDWPGFQRLVLTTQQREALDECENEAAGLFDAIAEDFPKVTVQDQGGGVTSFSAERDLKEPTKH